MTSYENASLPATSKSETEVVSYSETSLSVKNLSFQAYREYEKISPISESRFSSGRLMAESHLGIIDCDRIDQSFVCHTCFTTDSFHHSTLYHNIINLFSQLRSPPFRCSLYFLQLLFRFLSANTIIAPTVRRIIISTPPAPSLYPDGKMIDRRASPGSNVFKTLIKNEERFAALFAPFFRFMNARRVSTLSFRLPRNMPSLLSRDSAGGRTRWEKWETDLSVFSKQRQQASTSCHGN